MTRGQKNFQNEQSNEWEISFWSACRKSFWDKCTKKVDSVSSMASHRFRPFRDDTRKLPDGAVLAQVGSSLLDLGRGPFRDSSGLGDRSDRRRNTDGVLRHGQERALLQAVRFGHKLRSESGRFQCQGEKEQLVFLWLFWGGFLKLFRSPESSTKIEPKGKKLSRNWVQKLFGIRKRESNASWLA